MNLNVQEHIDEVKNMPLQFALRGQKLSSSVPLVFLHGWGSDSRCWNPLLAYLEDEFECLLIDLPGFGLNEKSDAVNLDRLLELLEQSIPKKSHLVGWSLGGMIATQLVTRYPDRFLSLTTIASNAKFVVSEEWKNACGLTVYQNFLDGFRESPESTLKGFNLLQGRGDRHRKALKNHTVQNPCLINHENKSNWSTALHWLDQIDNRETLQNMTAPHLAIFGENDALVPPSVREQFIDSSMCSQNLLISDAGHAPHITQPERVAQALKDSFKQGHNPYQCDKKRVAQSFSHAAQRYEKVAHMQAQVASKLLKLRDDYSGDLCDLGCGTGFCMDLIRPQNKNVVGLDIASGMLEYCQNKYQTHPANLICADFENLPIKPNAFDGIVSSLSIQWSENLDQLFQQVKGCLKKDGWFLFSTLGPKTLIELKESWRETDSFVHVNQFVSQQTILQKLKAAGFLIELVEQSNETLRYDTVFSLMRDLKDIGAHNVNAGKKKGLSTRRSFQCMAKAYETYRDAGSLPATYDVMYFNVRAS